MLTRRRMLFVAVVALWWGLHELVPARGGAVAAAELVIADGKKSAAMVVVSPSAGEWEQRGAQDLVRYVELMSGGRPGLADTAESVAAALRGSGPLLIVGQVALAEQPVLKESLHRVAKPNPLLRADAIVLKRVGNRVYLAGTNDDSHYYAVAELLRRWGCRWYMPTEFGECVPEVATLKIGELDVAYSPPFEVRRYWISWVGDTAGKPEFMRRNFLNEESVPNGHALGQYVKDLVPAGKTVFNVPITADKTAEHVARQVAPTFKAGQHVMLGMEDGLYQSDDPLDRELISLQYDKYFLAQSVTDAFLVFYNKVADHMLRAAPDSRAKIGFLAYANMTIPPVRDITARKPLVAYLAPIDIDPNHGMDDPRSAPRREYKAMLYKWAKVMERRVVIYDYDQGMLVWRDLPNPSVQAFRQDVKHYQRAGILGVDTESRNALATIFLNLHLRAALLWNPEFDVDAHVAEFYSRFYGPAARPMAEYWGAIDKAWADTIVTEHEYFVVPAIYTPELVARLRQHLAAAEAIVRPLASQPNLSRHEKLVVERMKFTRLGFEVLDAYTAMVRAAATECDFAAAVAAGDRGLAAREQLTAMNGLFTTYKQIGENGYAWWPGEVQQYRELVPFISGPKGQLVAKTPQMWSFRRDPQDVGAKAGWEKQKADLAAWNKLEAKDELTRRIQNPGHWEPIRTDLYLQAQGLVTADFQSYTGHGWYQTEVPLDAAQTQGPVHLRFPGLFNECWLYVNGQQVAHREFKGVWWMNDYRFEWDVDLTGKLQPGANSLTLRIHNPHHFGGLFRRPFLYRAAGP